jgi:hypothetical protein
MVDKKQMDIYSEFTDADWAVSSIYSTLDREMIKPLEYSIYVDQDGGKHLVVISTYCDINQLNSIYNYGFRTGRTCSERSKLFLQKRIARMQVNLKGIKCKVSIITVASILQKETFGPNDMQLMSDVLAWLHDIA